MIDAKKITNFKATDHELEELILFWILAAGKNGVTSAKCLDNFLTSWQTAFGEMRLSPFEIIEKVDKKQILPHELKRFGIGCFNRKAQYFRNIIYANLNLRTCTVEELENINGIGAKTARCFLIHSRKNQRFAALDTHVLKFLKDKGHEVPKSTPAKRSKKYYELEKIFLNYVKESGKTVAEFDLNLWNYYREKRSNYRMIPVASWIVFVIWVFFAQ